MDAWQFMNESPMLTFILACMILASLETAWKRWLRHRNIKAHGWPPAHLDADGELQSTDEGQS